MYRAPPLSPLVYLRRNPGMVLGTGFLAAAMVFLCVTALTIIAGFKSNAQRPFEQLRFFSLVVIEGKADTVAARRRQIAAHPAVERVLEARVIPVRMETLFSQLNLAVLAVPTEHHADLVARAGNRLASGRLPRRDAPEVALHETLVRVNRLRVGAEIAQGFRLVGVLSGPTPMGLIPLELLTSGGFLPGKGLEPHYLVLPRSGRRGEMNRYLGGLSGVALQSHERVLAQLERFTRGTMRILHAIALFLFLLAAVIFGIVHRVYFEEREDELALLTVLGLRPRTLLLRSLSETGIIGGAAWLLGVVLGVAGLAALQHWIFRPKGLEFPVLVGAPLGLSLLLPLSALLITWRTIRSALGHLDPVSILERRR